MKGLKCTSTTCELNNGGHCEAGILNIASNGVCKTKIRKKMTNIDDEYKRLEVAGEFDYDDNEDVLIECDDIHCKYNNDHICSAQHVCIKDCITRTKCTTRKNIK